MTAPLAQAHTLVWHNPDSRFYVEGCGLLRLGGSEWLAVVPVVPRSCEPELRRQRATLSRIHIVRSHDGGATWQKVADLPHYSAAPFAHAGAVYLFANNGGTVFRNDDLLLRRSDNGGATWSDPVTLFRGHFWNCHTAMLERDQRLYWAIDDLSFGDPYFRGPRAVAGDLTCDLLDPAAWRISNPVPFPGMPDMFKDPGHRGFFGKYLEPNVVAVHGRLRLLSAVRKNGVCAVFDLADDGDALDLQFCQYHPMPAGHLKFFVRWDAVSNLFWATGNPVVNSQGLADWSDKVHGGGDYNGGDRRLLMLYYSVDGLNWLQAGCVACARKLTQSFNYAAFEIDGDDLGIIARSNINGPSPHDADCATFHRVRDFRRLALDVWPDPA